MTLDAFSNSDRYVHSDGPRYDPGYECASPRCDRRAAHRHHLRRRGRDGISGGSDWLLDTETGDVLPATCGVCAPCHRKLTGGIGGHRAKILYVADPDRRLHWLERDGDDWESLGEIAWPVPPRFEAAA